MPEGPDEARAPAHAAQRAAGLITELAEVARAEVGKFVIFPVSHVWMYGPSLVCMTVQGELAIPVAAMYPASLVWGLTCWPRPWEIRAPSPDQMCGLFLDGQGLLQV